MTDPQTLDVCFRGNRTYIQGSLILSLAAETVGELKSATVAKCKFSTITDKGVYLRLENEASQDGHELIGEAVFKSDDETVIAYFFEDPDVTPPRQDDRPSLLSKLDRFDKLNGLAAYDIEPILDDLVAAVVEAVKALHQDISEDVYDIWFTGFSGAKFPVNSVDIASKGEIEIKNVMHRGSPEQYQTLFRVSVRPEGDAKDEFAFMLTFAYKTK